MIFTAHLDAVGFRASWRSTFGVTVLPDPPYTRFLELLELAEQQGFEYGWTYDSHVLWQESIPLLDARRRPHVDDEARPLRHQPGHARADGARERVRDAARHLRAAGW